MNAVCLSTESCYRHPLISLPASILWNQIKRICVYVCVFAWIVPKIKVSEWWGVEKKKEGKKRIYRWGRRRDRGSNEGSQMTVCWSEGILSLCAVCTMHGTNWMRLAWFQFSCVCLSLWTFIFMCVRIKYSFFSLIYCMQPYCPDQYHFFPLYCHRCVNVSTYHITLIQIQAYTCKCVHKFE